MPRFITLLLIVLLASAASLPALAQCHSTGENQTVAASPSQPTITDSPDTIALGVGEVEYGWQRAWFGGGAQASSSGVLYKFGVFCNFEFRTYLTPWETASGPGQSAASGIGDTWMTGQYRVHAQTRNLPALSIQYTLKQPTADSHDGFGSGQRDHIIAISAGKDFKQTSFNFETKYVLFGQSGNQAISRYQEYSLNATHALIRHFSLTSEIYGDTRSSAHEPGLVSTLWSIGYSPNPRMVFDAGIDLGLTHGAPNKRVFAGVTYAIGDFYKGLRHPHSTSD
jgi:hypothetical protein